jgi:hypothetical protein
MFSAIVAIVLIWRWLRTSREKEMKMQLEPTRGKNVIPAPSIPDFVHRKNGESTFESFCRSCFVTVATARSEAELQGNERNHICDPWDLKRFAAVAVNCRAPLGPL